MKFLLEAKTVTLIVTPRCTVECLQKDFWVIPPLLFVDLAELGSQLDLTLKVFSNLEVSMILKFAV